MVEQQQPSLARDWHAWAAKPPLHESGVTVKKMKPVRHDMDRRFKPTWDAVHKDIVADLAVLNKERQLANRAVNVAATNAARKTAAERAADQRHRTRANYWRGVARAREKGEQGGLEGVDERGNCKCPSCNS